MRNRNKSFLLISVILLGCFIPMAIAQESNVTRTLSRSEIISLRHVDVTLNVTINSESYYIIDEIYPEGWVVLDNGGLNDAEAGHLKYLEMAASSNTSFTYRIKPPNNVTEGTYSFSGTYSMEGMGSPVGMEGADSIDVAVGDGIYYPQNNTCVAYRNSFKIITYNCFAHDIDGRDITQYVTFEWQGGVALDTNWVFAYNNNLTSGSLYYWKNQSYQANEPYLINGTANITIHTVQKIETVGSPSDGICDLGNEWNSIARNVTQLVNGTTNVSTVYCFNEWGQFNSTAYWLRGTYDKWQDNMVTKYRMRWSDITGQVSHLGYNLLDRQWQYYLVRNATFQPDERLETKWVFTPKNSSKSGKWHILGWKSGQSLGSALTADEFIYQDPMWNSSWTENRSIEINTSTPKINIQVKFTVPYDSDMKSDFSDLRFTNNCSGDAEELYAWNESQTDGSSVTVWLNLSRWGTNNTYCMHYGNPNATANWDGNRTFVWFDTFETYSNNTDIIGQGGWEDMSSGSGRFYVRDDFGQKHEGDKVLYTNQVNTNHKIKHSLPILAVGSLIVHEAYEGTSYYFNIDGMDAVGNGIWYTRTIDVGATDYMGIQMNTNTELAEPKTNNLYKWNFSWHETSKTTVCLENFTMTNCKYDTNFGSRNNPPYSIGLTNVDGATAGNARWDSIALANTTYPLPIVTLEPIPPELNITIVSPTNTTYNVSTVYFNITGSNRVDWAVVEVNATNYTMFNDTTQMKTNLSLANGTYQAMFWANNTYDNWDTESVWFSVQVDTIFPIITIHSPTNITYYASAIDLNMTANEVIDTWLYDLNSGGNTTFTPNTTITAQEGSNHLIVYANDTFGNMNSTDIYFTYLDVPVVTVIEPQNNSNHTTSVIGLNFTVSGVTKVQTIYNTTGFEGFEAYPLSNLVGNGNWSQYAGYPYSNVNVTDSKSYSGSKSVRIPDVSAVEWVRLPFDKAYHSGYISMKVMVNGTDPFASFGHIRYDQQGLSYLRFKGNNIEMFTDTAETSDPILIISNFARNEWYDINISWTNTSWHTGCAWNSSITNCSTVENYGDPVRVSPATGLWIGMDSNASSDANVHFDDIVYPKSVLGVDPPEYCWYSLNGGANMTITQCLNTTISATDGWNNITVYANDTFSSIGQSDYVYFNVSIPLSLGSISADTPIDPIENQTIQVEAFVNATGSEFDVGNCSLYKPSSEILNWVLAVETAVNSTFTSLNCTFNMAYYEINGTYNITVVANNTLAVSDQADTTFAYNLLSAFVLNETVLDFGTLNIGQSSVTTFNMTNTGNQNISLEINGTDMVGAHDIIGVSNFTFDDDSDMSDALALSTSFQPFTILSVLEEATGWLNITVPLGTYPEQYNSNVTIRA